MVFLVKSFGEREFHFPQCLIEAPNVALATARDRFFEIFRREPSGGSRVVIVPSCCELGRPAIVVITNCGERYEPLCRKGFNDSDWISAATVLDDSSHLELRLSAATRQVFGHLFSPKPAARETVPRGYDYVA
jgi:hypothetical protein